jgi:hypothetical protein
MLCALCGVSEVYNKHHPLPASRGGKEKVGICKECHDMIHASLTNKELAKKYDSVEALRTHPVLSRWLAWRKKHPNVAVRSKWTHGRHCNSRSKFS